MILILFQKVNRGVMEQIKDEEDEERDLHFDFNSLGVGTIGTVEDLLDFERSMLLDHNLPTLFLCHIS